MSWFTNIANQAFQLADGLVAQAESAERELNREHAVIKKEKEEQVTQQLSSTRLPWESGDESKAILSNDLMELILAIPMAEENFTVSPSIEKHKILYETPFSFKQFIPVIMRLLQLDSNLAKIHAKLSPKMNEEIFWRNYYLRVIYLRAKSGIDGEEAAINIGQLPEKDFLFTYTPSVSSPLPTSPMARTPQQNDKSKSNKQTLQHNLQSPVSPVLTSPSTPATPKYIEESYTMDDSYDHEQDNSMSTSELVASFDLLHNDNRTASKNGPGKPITGPSAGSNTGVSKSVTAAEAAAAEERARVRREEERKQQEKAREQARLAAEVEAELQDLVVASKEPTKPSTKNSTKAAANSSSSSSSAAVTGGVVGKAPIPVSGGTSKKKEEEWVKDLDLDLDLADFDDDLVDLGDDDELEAQIARELEDL